MKKTLDSTFVETLLCRVQAGHVKIVVVNHHRYSFREKGKEIGFIDRRTASIKLGTDEYMPVDENSAKELHRQVAVDQGHKLEV